MLSEQDRYFIRNTYNGEVPELSGPREAVAQIAAYLVERGADEVEALNRADYLWHRVRLLQADHDAQRWGNTTHVREAAEKVQEALDVIERALDQRSGDNRLLAATAKALALGWPEPGEADLTASEQEAAAARRADAAFIEAMTGQDRPRVQQLMTGLPLLREALTRVIVAHHPAGPGRPPRELHAEVLADLANHYASATGRWPSINSDGAHGGISGDFPGFAQLVSRMANALPFSEQDFKNLRAKLAERRRK